MKKAMSLLTATAMAATLLAGCGGGAASSSAAPAADSTSTEASSTAAEPAADAAAEEGKVLNIWCWNDEFQSRFNDYYPGVKEIAADKSTTTLDNGVTVKWTINPNDNNNYQNKLDEALLKQDSAAADDKIDIFLIEADYALKYVDSEYTLDVKKDVGLTDDDLKDQYQYTKDIVTVDGVQKGTTWQATPGLFAYRRSIAKDVLGTDDPTEVQAALNEHHPEIFLSAVQRLIQQLGQNRSLSKMYMYHVLYDLLAQMYRAYGIQDRNEIGRGINRILSCNTAAAMCGVLEEIMASLQGTPEPQTEDSSAIIRQVQKIVDAEYGEPLSLEYIAEKVYITPSYLSYIFKQMTGQNLIKYITDLRMYKARRMVADGNLKISQIARNCGYDNPSYFNKLFKNYFGVTPRQYREGERDESIV